MILSFHNTALIGKNPPDNAFPIAKISGLIFYKLP